MAVARRHIEVSRDLLRRTVGLPHTEQGLLGALAECRYTVYAIAALSDRLRSSSGEAN
jgi:hypothetical protein